MRRRRSGSSPPLLLWAVPLLVAGRLCMPAGPAVAGQIAASHAVEVLRVYDGDTLQVRMDEGARARREKVRFVGIDAPEAGHGGRAEMGADLATEALRRWLKGRHVHLVLGGGPDHRDQYGRLLAYVEDEAGADAGLWLLKQGRVRLFRKFRHPREKTYRAAESAARLARVGLWAGGADGELRGLRQAGVQPIQVYPTGGDLWAVCVGRWGRLEIPTARLSRLLLKVRALQLRYREPQLATELRDLGFMATAGCAA